MTLGVAWIRSTGNVSEIVVASDSLLSAEGSAEAWRGCPKILSLPRTDAVLSFSGATEFAYPAMLQAHRAIGAHPANVSREYDVTYCSHLVESVINQMNSLVTTGARASLQETRKMTNFLLSGYSWRDSRPYIWRYSWSKGARRYIRSQVKPRRDAGGSITYYFIGSIDARGAAEHEMKKQIDAGLRSLDMEPFNVLVDIIRSPDYRDVGGAPQVAKVYRHLNYQFFNTQWQMSGSWVETYAGRPLLDFERSATPSIHPDVPAHFGKSQRS